MCSRVSFALLLLALVCLHSVTAVSLRHRLRAAAVSDVEADSDSDVEVSVETDTELTDATSITGAPLDATGRFTYSNRDGSLLHINAVVKCITDCNTAQPTLQAKLSGTDIFLANLTFAAGNLIAFGQGPPPALFSGCGNAPITLVLAHDSDAKIAYANYAPCKKFAGGASIYTRYANVQDKNALSDGVMSVTDKLLHPLGKQKVQPPPVANGKYKLVDRTNPAAAAQAVSIALKAGTGSAAAPAAYTGTYPDGRVAFEFSFVPINLAAFGEYVVYRGNAVCGRTKFTFVVPNKEHNVKGDYLAAVAPLPACQFAGQALYINKA